MCHGAGNCKFIKFPPGSKIKNRRVGGVVRTPVRRETGETPCRPFLIFEGWGSESCVRICARVLLGNWPLRRTPAADPRLGPEGVPAGVPPWRPCWCPGHRTLDHRDGASQHDGRKSRLVSRCPGVPVSRWLSRLVSWCPGVQVVVPAGVQVSRWCPGCVCVCVCERVCVCVCAWLCARALL